MRASKYWIGCLWLFLIYSCGASDSIIKVLPQFLDQKGRTSVSPSLYDRDAYQARLRRNPEQRQGMRFAVNWKADSNKELKLRLELRGAKVEKQPLLVLEKPARHTTWFSKWTDIEIAGEDYNKIGEVLAWRVSLWDGERLLAEQKSFLW